MSVHDFSLNDLANELTATTITSAGTLYTTSTTTGTTSAIPVSTTFSIPWYDSEADKIKEEFKKYKDATDKHIDELEADIDYLSDSYKKAVEQLVLMQEAFNQATVKALVVAEAMEKIKNIDAIEQVAKEAASFNERLQTNEELVNNLLPEVYHLKQQLNSKE